MAKQTKHQKVRYSYRMYPDTMAKLKRVSDVLEMSQTRVIEKLFNEEVTLDGLYDMTFNIVRDGEDESTLS